MAQKNNRNTIMLFPPNLSVKIPKGNRKIAPTSTGTPSNHPICTGFHLYTPLFTRKVTNTPLIIQAAKHTVKARVLSKSIRPDMLFDEVLMMIAAGIY